MAPPRLSNQHSIFVAFRAVLVVFVPAIQAVFFPQAPKTSTDFGKTAKHGSSESTVTRQVHRHPCVTGQHREMLDQVLDAFDIVPEYDLSIMKKNQTLFDVTINIMSKMKAILEEINPDVVLVHGDTSTTFVTALSCFYLQILFNLFEKQFYFPTLSIDFRNGISREFKIICKKSNFSSFSIF